MLCGRGGVFFSKKVGQLDNLKNFSSIYWKFLFQSVQFCPILSKNCLFEGVKIGHFFGHTGQLRAKNWTLDSSTV